MLTHDVMQLWDMLEIGRRRSNAAVLLLLYSTLPLLPAAMLPLHPLQPSA